MGHTPQDTEIGGRRYECVPFEFDDCLELKFELLGLLGDPLGRLAAGFFDGGADHDFGKDQIVAAVRSLPQAILTKGPGDLAGRIMANTFVVLPVKTRNKSGKKAQKVRLDTSAGRDAAFGDGRWGDFYRALFFALKVNFGPFFEAASPVLGELSSSLTGVWKAFTQEIET